jgi:hypothetical protein
VPAPLRQANPRCRVRRESLTKGAQGAILGVWEDAIDPRTTDQSSKIWESFRGVEPYAERRSSISSPSAPPNHNLILDAADNSRLAALIRKVTEMPLVYKSYVWYSHDQPKISGQRHREITTAIEAGDEATAETVMKTHILEARTPLLAHLNEVRPNAEEAPSD